MMTLELEALGHQETIRYMQNANTSEKPGSSAAVSVAGQNW